jgi:tRNA nucleotidyltransferase (CCA-adding enzyme)
MDLLRTLWTAGHAAYVVGGSLRDTLLGRMPVDWDLATDALPEQTLELFPDAVYENRFGTVVVRRRRREYAITTFRTDHDYADFRRPHRVEFGTSLDADLARRDFTINAMAVPLAEPGRLIDPRGGLADLRQGLLRILHDGSFVDDPTRALRAARYAARLGLSVEEATLGLLRRTNLATVSADRVQAELRRLAGERDARQGFELLDEWGVLSLPPQARELIDAVSRLVASEQWGEVANPADAILAAARGATEEARELARRSPGKASEAVRAARGHSGTDLALARALGAEWLDRYVSQWRDVRPSISGEDLLAAGVPQGPAVGRGLEAALEARLDGLASTRDGELEIALAAARSEA